MMQIFNKPRERFDWRIIEPFYQKLLTEDLTVKRIPGWLDEWSDLEKILAEARAVTERAKYENTADEVAEKAYLHFVENVLPYHQYINQAMTKKLLAIDYQPLPKHQQMFKRFMVEEKLFREENIHVFQDIEKLNLQFEQLSGSMTIELEGDMVTMSHIVARLENPDRPKREQALKALYKAERQISEKLDSIILELVKQRRKLAENAGLANFCAYHWQATQRFDDSPEDALEFISSIEQEVIPILASMYETHRQKLRVETLRPWDFGFNPDSLHPLRPSNTVKELEDGVECSFHQLDPELARQFASMRNGWLDIEDRPNKISGIGSCIHFPVSKMPYICYNVTGMNSDILVTLHEMGHAFHAFAVQDTHPLIWNHWPSPEFLEVASQAMELLALPYYAQDNGGFYTSEETARAKKEQLLQVLLVFLRYARQAALQHWLSSEAPLDLWASHIDEKWKDLGQRFYPFVDWQGLDEERAEGWQSFNTFVTPFSDLEYAMAYLGAIQIWRNSLEDKKKALDQYRFALSLGASRPLPELFVAAGATFSFDRKTVRELVSFVVQQIETI